MNQVAKEILFKTKRKIFGFNIGNNSSIFQGSGIDFSEIKEYAFGDDVRKINWKVTAKEQKPYVNIFNEERELNVLLSLLVSGSLFFGTKRLKIDLITEILSLLSYSTLKNSDNLTTLFFSNKEEFFQPPTKKMGALNRIIEEAYALELLKKQVDYSAYGDYIQSRLKRRSLIFVIGDFYGDVDLTPLCARNEVYAIVVRDKFEEYPSFEGSYELVNPENMQHASLSLSKGQLTKYQNRLKAHDESMIEQFRKHRITHTKIYTDEEPYLKLFEMFRS